MPGMNIIAMHDRIRKKEGQFLGQVLDFIARRHPKSKGGGIF